MTKEIHDINARAVDFVVELIDYIFEYPDDDYMTMECLCRKLVKHGLLDKADGYYQTHDKTEPSNSEKPNNCEPKICDTCRYYNSNIPCGSTPSVCKEADKFAEEFVDGLKKLKPKVEPTISKMEQVDKDINVRSKDEPQTDEYCDYCKMTHKYWYEHCDICKNKPKTEPTTQTKTQKSN